MELQGTRDDKDQLQQTLDLAIFRGDFLEERLSHALEKTGENQSIVEGIIGAVESGNDQSRTKWRLLLKENEDLQSQLKLAKVNSSMFCCIC